MIPTIFLVLLTTGAGAGAGMADRASGTRFTSCARERLAATPLQNQPNRMIAT